MPDFDPNRLSIDLDELLFAILIAILLSTFPLVAYLVYEDGKDWDKFKVEHNCKKVSQVKGDVFNTFGVGINGKASVGVAVTSDKEGFLCNDGITYYR